MDAIRAQDPLHALAIPGGGAILSKEDAAHVVVDADNLEA